MSKKRPLNEHEYLCRKAEPTLLDTANLNNQKAYINITVEYVLNFIVTRCLKIDWLVGNGVRLHGSGRRHWAADVWHSYRNSCQHSTYASWFTPSYLSQPRTTDSFVPFCYKSTVFNQFITVGFLALLVSRVIAMRRMTFPTFFLNSAPSIIPWLLKCEDHEFCNMAEW